jgi:Na+/H+-dicarboxylate symporter
MFKQNVSILISAILAIAVGYFCQDYSQVINTYVKPFGTIFLNLLLWMVVPFIFVSIILGVSSLRDVKSVRSIGVKSIVYFFVTTVLAVLGGICIALSCENFFPKLTYHMAEQVSHETANFSFIDAIVNLFPSNFIEVFYKGNMIQIIVAAIFIGIAMIILGKKVSGLAKFIMDLNLVFSTILKIILKASPIAVFFLLCPIIAEYGTSILGSLGVVVLIAYVCYILHAVIIYSLFLIAFSDVKPWEFYKYMFPAITFAFSSTSSVGTIPLSMQCTRKIGVDNKISSFVLTMGATVNMDGTAIFQSIATIFIAFCYGVDLTAPQLFILAFTIIITSIGTAGIPSGGVLMLSIILTSVGLPIEGIAIIIGIDRIFDMGRSVINVLGDATCAVIVDCSERKKEAEYQEKREQELRDNVGVDPTLGKPEYMITPEDLLKKQKLNAGPKLSPEDIIKQQREAKLQQEQQAQMARKEKADGYYDDDLVIRIDLDDDNK